MSRASQLKAVGVVALLAAGVWTWSAWWPSDERAIRDRLHDLADAFNEGTTDGLGTVARAAQIGSYFTEDVVLDLGHGMPPVHGREPLIGMAARLQPGAAGYTLDFDDISVTVAPNAAAADVTLAATLSRRNPSTGERSIDARELQLALRKIDGVWRIARVSAIDTLRRE